MATLNAHEVRCAACGSAFTAMRQDAKFCSVNCRVAAHLARRSANPDVQAELDALRAQVKELKARLADGPKSKRAADAPQATIDTSARTIDLGEGTLRAKWAALTAEIETAAAAEERKQMKGWMRRYRTLLDGMFWWNVGNEVDKELRKRMPGEHARLNEAERKAEAKQQEFQEAMDATRLGVMDKEAFAKIVAALHESKHVAAGSKVQAQMTAALAILNPLKDRLVFREKAAKKK